MAIAQKRLLESLFLILELTYDINVALMQVNNTFPSTWASNAKNEYLE